METHKLISFFHSIQVRVAVFTLVVLILFSGTEFLVQRHAVLKRFERFEMERALADLDRGANALARECDHLKMFTNDWSLWDDTYDFIENLNRAYIESNLYWDVFKQNELNFISFRDINGRAVWQNGFDLSRDEPTDIEVQLSDALIQRVISRADEAGKDAAIAGLVRSTAGPMLVAVCPILKSDGSGPVRGTLLMGRVLTDEVQNTLREQTDLHIRFDVWDKNQQGGDGLQQDWTKPRVEYQDASLLIVNKTLFDLAGDPFLCLHLTTPREILRAGRDSAQYAFLLTLGAGLTTLLILLLQVHSFLIRPLLQLASHVSGIIQTGDLSRRIHMRRSDEVGVLAEAFDQLVARVERDFAERKRAEQALQENEMRLQTILETAPDGILVLDENYKIVLANAAAHQVFGKESLRLPGGSFETFFAQNADWEDWQKALCSLVEAKETTSSFAMEVAGNREGKVFPLYTTTGVFEFRGKRFYTVALRDLTEFQAMQDKVRRAERLAAIGEMSAAIAHELRNPLTGISGFLQLLQINPAAAGTGSGEMFREALQQVRRMDNTVQQLLMYARPWNPDRVPYDLREIVELAQKDVQGRKELHDVRFEWADEGKNCREVKIDPNLMRQVFVNLFENAAQAMGGSGCISVAFESDRDYVRVLVKDTGPGIPGDAEDQCFQPFYTTKSKGVGLGLAICRQIVEAHQGTIRLINHPEGGACAIVEIPHGE